MAAVDTPTKTFARPALDELRAEVDKVRPGAAVGAFITGVLYVLFFLLAKGWRLFWRGWAWAYVAGRRGWRAGMGQPEAVPSTAELIQIIDGLQKQLARYETGFVAPAQPVK